MKTIIKFDRLFVVSESHNLYFDQKFSNKINIIVGVIPRVKYFNTEYFIYLWN
jgi:hypothetical protein